MLTRRPYSSQLKLILPIISFIYLLKIFGYSSNINTITLALIASGIFIQSYTFLSSSTFCFNGKDKIHTYITLISAIFYCSSLRFLIVNFGISGAAGARIIYFIITLLLGFFIDKIFFKNNTIINYKKHIFYPSLKISSIIFLLTSGGLISIRYFMF